MDAKALSILNLKEVRRRSIKVWNGIPDDHLGWKADENSATFGETIRHVWTSIPYYFEVLKAKKSVPDYQEDESPIVSVADEIARSQVSFEAFLGWIEALKPQDLEDCIIDRSDVGYRRSLGDMLVRVAYHEAVHTGQLLQAMRMAGLDRPKVWD